MMLASKWNQILLWLTLTETITLCGCGGGDRPTATTATASQSAISSSSASSSTSSSVLRIQWIGQPSSTNNLWGNVQVVAWAGRGASALTKVEFFVDGKIVATSMSGAALPGVSLQSYSGSWDTRLAADGTHTLVARVTDAAGLTAETPNLVVSLKNNVAIPVVLSAGEVFPLPVTGANGTGQLAINLATGAISGDVALAGMSATAVHLHNGFATTSGEVIVTLNKDPLTGHWVIPTGSTLTVPVLVANAQINSFLSGGLYLDAHSLNYPEAEIRAQLIPESIAVAFSRLSGDQEIPAVITNRIGVAAVTVDTLNRRFQINVRLNGVTDLVSVGVYKGGNLPTFDNWQYFIRPDANGNLVYTGSTAAGSAYDPTAWYVNVVTFGNPNGELRGPFPIAPAVM